MQVWRSEEDEVYTVFVGPDRPVVSANSLGVVGTNGWYCSQADVDKFPALSGWRGLLDPTVQRYFNRTFIGFQPDWGPDTLIMQTLGLGYDVVYLGDEAEAIIEQRLAASIPTFFYLWSPHPLTAKYPVSRIQLPGYTDTASFDAGKSDYPPGEMLEKVASGRLATIAPRVFRFYSRFTIDTSAQISMMRMVTGEVSSKDATCTWLQSPQGIERRKRWLLESAMCATGFYAPTSFDGDHDIVCQACAVGTSSPGGDVTGCTQCPPGTPHRATPCTHFVCIDSPARIPPPSQRDSCRPMHWMMRNDGPPCFDAGSFQSREAQASCVSCDDLGAFYQEEAGQSACNACPLNTARFSGTTKTINASACQCIEGTSCFSMPSAA